MSLQDQVALVTGASHGLGLAIAHALGAERASIACLARPGRALDDAAAALSAGGGKAIAVPADVTQAAEVERAVATVIETWGRLDIVVLNAGTWAGAPLHETTEEMWDRLLDLNLKGAFLTLRAAIPWFLRQRRGTVIGIDSLGGRVGQAGSAAYAASKWGLRGLLESAALELKPHRVRVSLVAPHMMNSDLKPIDPASPDRDRTLEVREVASLVAFICTAPDHVSIGNATIWPLSTGIKAVG
jgi:NAD(P)-dependent dehydrogenase (short-subunit alcohol dehydrogenase family)